MSVALTGLKAGAQSRASGEVGTLTLPRAQAGSGSS